MSWRVPTSLLAVLVVPLFLTACAGNQPEQVEPVLSPEWTEMTIYATGRGAPPEDASSRAQARALARRAARAQAQRKLAERVYGLTIRSETTVEDAVVEEDIIRSEMDAFLENAREVGSTWKPELGIYEVRMALRLGEQFEKIVFR